MLESIKFKLARVWGTCETPAILYLLSVQATDVFWSEIWLLIATAKFAQNVYLDYLITAQRLKQIEMMKSMHEGFASAMKKEKEKDKESNK